MTNSIFKNKEHYLSFRAAWKTAANNAMAKNGASTTLGAEHHILCNILRGRAFDRGFTPITSTNKLSNGAIINHGLYFGMDALNRIQKIAKEIIGGKGTNAWSGERITQFLAPFNNTITVEVLAALDLPDVKPLESSFGKSRALALKIISGEFKPTTFKQIYDVLGEVA